MKIEKSKKNKFLIKLYYYDDNYDRAQTVLEIPSSKVFLRFLDSSTYFSPYNLKSRSCLELETKPEFVLNSLYVFKRTSFIGIGRILNGRFFKN